MTEPEGYEAVPLADYPAPEEGRDVLLAFPHPDYIAANFALSVLAAATTLGTPVARVLGFRTGPLLSMARGAIALEFLATNLPWLWMVDADMVFNHLTLPALLDWADPQKRPVLGALCHTLTREGKSITTAYRNSGDGSPFFDSIHEADLPPDQPMQVDATGAACLLVHRSVFGRLGCEPHMAFAERVAGGRPFGEDVSFCMRLAEAGIPVHVHTGIRVGHLKQVQIGDLAP